jgi:hypothetical protein
MEQHHPDRPGKFNPGAGVIGLGGYWIGPATDPKSGKPIRGGEGGPGVVGIAGRTNYHEPLPDFANAFGAYSGIGVYGASSTKIGVAGVGNFAGVVGKSSAGRGGWFVSSLDPFPKAQLHLEPVQIPFPKIRSHDYYAVTCIRPQEVTELPKAGLPGDLLVIAAKEDAGVPAALWFCTKGGGADGKDGVAEWREVLLGPAIQGQR